MADETNERPVTLPELPTDIEAAVRGQGHISRADLDFVRRDAVLADRAATSAAQQESEAALTRFKESIGDEPDPFQRLKFFCSMAMTGQDWLDSEPLFDAVEDAKRTTAPSEAAPRNGPITFDEWTPEAKTAFHDLIAETFDWPASPQSAEQATVALGTVLQMADELGDNIARELRILRVRLQAASRASQTAQPAAQEGEE